jgi:type I restriction enzyme R subunit
VNRRFSHVHEGVLTEKDYGLVVDYHGVSKDLDDALNSFSPSDVKGAMYELDEDPAPSLEAAAAAAESHFAGRDLDDIWDCLAIFAPDADTEGNYKADVYERFSSDYRQFARLMDRTLPDPKALPYTDRLACLTIIRSRARSLYLQEDASLNWTDIGAKVKRLVDERIDADVRELMKPVSVLDDDFDQKIAEIPHDEARASMMEHTIRSYITERLADNPGFYGKLSDQLELIIKDLRNRVIDAAEAVRRQSELKKTLHNEADIAAGHGLSPVAFAVYELINTNGSPRLEGNEDSRSTDLDPVRKAIAVDIESAVMHHQEVVDWQSNPDVQREMRRDVKRTLRPTGDYSEGALDDLANQIVEVARHRSTR